MRYLGGLIVLALAGTASAAVAAPIVQTAAFAQREANWADAFTFQKADPALGVVSNATLAVTGTVSGRVQIENRDQSAVGAITALDGTVSVSQPNGAAFVTVNPYASDSASLAAFDGAVDFAGASGRTIDIAPRSLTATRTLTRGSLPGGADAIAAFVGTGTVDLPVAASVRSTVSAGGNVTGRVRADIGAEGTLTYTQDPAGVPGGGGGGGVVVTLCCPWPKGKPEIASTAPQVRTFGPQVTGWSELLRFDGFDPTLGPLWSIDLTLTLPASFSHRLENIGGNAATVLAIQTAELSLRRASSSLIGKTSTNYTASYDAAGFDGAEDGAGASGGMGSAVGAVSKTFVLDSDADAWAYENGTPVELLLESNGWSFIAGANFWFDLSALAGAEVTLAYNYAVGPGSLTGYIHPDGRVAYDIHGRTVFFADVPAPGGLALIVPVLALLAFRRRIEG